MTQSPSQTIFNGNAFKKKNLFWRKQDRTGNGIVLAERAMNNFRNRFFLRKGPFSYYYHHYYIVIKTLSALTRTPFLITRIVAPFVKKN